MAHRWTGLVGLLVVGSSVACGSGEAPADVHLPLAPAASAAEGVAAAAPGLREALQGRWQATDDPQAVVEFKGDTKVESYSGQVMSSDPYVLADAAPDQGGKVNGAGPYIWVGQGTEQLVYYVVNVTPTSLELSYVGRGNTLSYTRIP